MYLCLYNEKTKQTRAEIEELDPIRFPYTRQSYVLQCQLEPDWTPYCGEVPFAFPVDNPPQ